MIFALASAPTFECVQLVAEFAFIGLHHQFVASAVRPNTCFELQFRNQEMHEVGHGGNGFLSRLGSGTDMLLRIVSDLRTSLEDDEFFIICPLVAAQSKLAIRPAGRAYVVLQSWVHGSAAWRLKPSDGSQIRVMAERAISMAHMSFAKDMRAFAKTPRTMRMALTAFRTKPPL